MKYILGAEDAGILSIEAERQTYTELIHGLLALWVGRLFIVGQDYIVEHTDNLTDLDADFQLFLQMSIGVIHQEGEPVILFLKIDQLNHLWSVVGSFHIVDFVGDEVAGNNPARVHYVLKTSSVATPLLVGNTLGTDALPGIGRQIYVGAFCSINTLVGCRRLVAGQSKKRWVSPFS